MTETGKSKTVSGNQKEYRRHQKCPANYSTNSIKKSSVKPGEACRRAISVERPIADPEEKLAEMLRRKG